MSKRESSSLGSYSEVTTSKEEEDDNDEENEGAKMSVDEKEEQTHQNPSFNDGFTSLVKESRNF